MGLRGRRTRSIPYFALSTSEKARVERLALRLYDRMNPDQDRVINISKEECLQAAMARLFPPVPLPKRNAAPPQGT
jgi:hypothetical protein